MKNSFILYTEFYEVMKDLTDEQIGKLHRAIYIYQLERKIIDLEPELNMAFKFLKVQLDKNQTKWEEEKIKRSEAGKKGMQSRWHKEDITNDNKDNKDNKCYDDITKITSITDNVNVDVNVDVNNINNNKKEKINKKEKSLVAKANTPQAEVFEYFAKLYKQETNIDYLGKGIDYINLAKLIKKYGKALVIQKIKWLLVGCKNSVFFFSKDMTDFNISTLTAQWDRILPKLTDEQKKEQDKFKKESEKKKWVMEQLKKQGIVIDESSKGGLSVIS